MAMKFHSTLGALKRALEQNRITGSWERKPNVVHMLRTSSGANLFWASGRKTVWFDGKPGPRQVLEAATAAMLHRLPDGLDNE